METLAALLGLASPDLSASMQLVLPLTGDAERRVVRYQCEGVAEMFAVEYVNAAPNFLAIVPVDGSKLIFVSNISADGARYVSGPYEWWSRGTEATFADLRDSAAGQLTCTEAAETP